MVRKGTTRKWAESTDVNPTIPIGGAGGVLKAYPCAKYIIGFRPLITERDKVTLTVSDHHDPSDCQLERVSGGQSGLLLRNDLWLRSGATNDRHIQFHGLCANFDISFVFEMREEVGILTCQCPVFLNIIYPNVCGEVSSVTLIFKPAVNNVMWHHVVLGYTRWCAESKRPRGKKWQRIRTGFPRGSRRARKK